MAITNSRVRDTRKPIRSRSALFQASKTLDTLQTAQAILRVSDSPQYVLDALQRDINQLTHEIRAYYQEYNANKDR